MKQHGMKIRIGIDPAFRKDGFGCCIIDESREVAFRYFTGFLDFLLWLWSEESPAREAAVSIVIENSNLQDVTFNRGKVTRGQYGAQSRDAGKNMAISQCTVDACIAWYGAQKVRGVSPRQKGAKWSKPYAQAVAKGMGLEVKFRKQDDVDAFQLALMG